jgi:hypothetical protein
MAKLHGGEAMLRMMTAAFVNGYLCLNRAEMQLARNYVDPTPPKAKPAPAPAPQPGIRV